MRICKPVHHWALIVSFKVHTSRRTGGTGTAGARNRWDRRQPCARKNVRDAASDPLRPKQWVKVLCDNGTDNGRSREWEMLSCTSVMNSRWVYCIRRRIWLPYHEESLGARDRSRTCLGARTSPIPRRCAGTSSGFPPTRTRWARVTSDRPAQCSALAPRMLRAVPSNVIPARTWLCRRLPLCVVQGVLVRAAIP